MKKLIVGLMVFLSPLTGFSEEKTNKEELVMEVKGVVCSFCSHGLSKKLNKLDFVEDVYTNLEEGKITLTLKKDGDVDKEKIKEVIKEGGYELLRFLPGKISYP